MYVSLGQTPGSGISQTLPSGGGYPPPSGSSALPGTSIAPSSSGSTQISLMSNWTYHPAVIMGMQQNQAVFTSPQQSYLSWRALADSILVQLGVIDPANPSAYQDAVWALASAYGYYFMPGTGRMQLAVQQGAAAAAQVFLSSDAYAMVTYAAYAKAQAQAAGTSAPGARKMGVFQKPTVIARPTTPAPGTPGAPAVPGAPAAPAASSNTWLYLGGAAVLGAAAYFLI